MPQLGFDFVPAASPQEQLIRDGRGLPDDLDGLLREAKAALSAINAAIVKGERYRPQFTRLRAIVERWRVLKHVAAEDAAEELGAALQAADGKVPTWGRRGRFIMTARECRILILWPGALDDEFPGFEAFAIDFDRPWLTSTGYRDFGGIYEEPQGTVIAYVRRRIAEAQQRMIGGKCHARPLEEIVENPYDDEPPGPPPGDPAWQAGGWIFEYRAKHPLPET